MAILKHAFGARLDFDSKIQVLIKTTNQWVIYKGLYTAVQLLLWEWPTYNTIVDDDDDDDCDHDDDDDDVGDWFVAREEYSVCWKFLPLHTDL